MRAGEADGDPEGDGRRTLANGWERGLPSCSLGGHVH